MEKLIVDLLKSNSFGISWAFLQDILHGFYIAFFGIDGSYLGTDDIRKLLRAYKIEHWGVQRTTAGDMIYFTVFRSQAQKTLFILERAGIPVLSQPGWLQ